MKKITDEARKRLETAAVLRHLTALGCNCTPDIEIRPVAGMPGLFNTVIAHDGWCALVKPPSKA